MKDDEYTEGQLSSAKRTENDCLLPSTHDNCTLGQSRSSWAAERRPDAMHRVTPMTRQSVTEDLEHAAQRIGDISRADLQILLRRAALMLRNVGGVPLEPATADALDSVAAEMKIGRPDLIQIILREWLETNAYLPVRTIDEESETDGSA
ncbi:hypothetical protein [Mesorhizobium sp. M0118]|uniref:hypothetical protein n=2 Tax=Mesorhizobium TaxID=68287 RepID=UPI0033367D12